MKVMNCLRNIVQANGPVTGGTLYPHWKCHKTFWVSSDHKTRNQIDHFVVCEKWKRSLLTVKNKKQWRPFDAGQSTLQNHSYKKIWFSKETFWCAKAKAKRSACRINLQVGHLQQISSTHNEGRRIRKTMGQSQRGASWSRIKSYRISWQYNKRLDERERLEQN